MPLACGKNMVFLGKCGLSNICLLIKRSLLELTLFSNPLCSLLIAAPELDAWIIVQELLPLLSYSASFAIYHQYLQVICLNFLLDICCFLSCLDRQRKLHSVLYSYIPHIRTQGLPLFILLYFVI